jgi:SnoaL-like domain
MLRRGKGKGGPTVLSTEDVLAIQSVLALYAHLVDRREGHRMGEVFMTDAVKETVGADALSNRQEGLAELTAWYSRDDVHPPGHNVHTILVYERDGEVHADSKWMIVDPSTGGVSTGDYEDVLVHSAAGWRISLRRTTVRYLASRP